MKNLIVILLLTLTSKGFSQIQADPTGKAPVFFYDNAEVKASAVWGQPINKGYNYFSGGDHNPANENQTGSIKVVSNPGGIRPRLGNGAYEHRVKYVANQYPGGQVPDLSFTRSEWYMFGGGQDYINWQWAAMSVLLPTDFHYDANRMSIGFDCKFSDAQGPASFILFIEKGNFVVYYQDPRNRKDSSKIIGPATRGAWQDFVLNRNFSTGSDGFIRFYQNGKLVFERYGPNYDVNRAGYMLNGIYKWPWANTWWQNEPPSTSTKDIVIYTDEIRYGNEQATLAAMSPSGSNPNPEPPINNLPPTVFAGNDIITTSLPVTLQAIASDPEGGALTYKWENFRGSITLSSTTALRPQVTRANNGSNGLRLTVTDNKGATATDTVSFTYNGNITPVNRPPVVYAGDSQTVVNNAAQLNGVASDPDGDVITSKWEVISGTGTLSNTTILKPTVSNLATGKNVFRLTVTDSKGTSASSQTTVTYSPPLPATAYIVSFTTTTKVIDNLPRIVITVTYSDGKIITLQ